MRHLFARTQQKDTLEPVETPHTGWEQLGLYIFSLKNMHYLLTVNYFSWFPVGRKLQSLHSVSVIKHLKEIFTEIGVPKCIVSDGGTHITSQELGHTTQNHITHQCTVQFPGRVLCTDYQKQSNQSHGRRGRLTFSYPFIHHNTLEPHSILTSRVNELKKIQMFVTTQKRATEMHPTV